ncbi:MAG: glycosyltransferase [Flavobacteriaceae bacterium]|nr:glycosyltransferase [Flavobacteriaceae bacterium]
MELKFSIIIPVYNRPQEIDELLQSLAKQNFVKDFEILIIEDGSILKSDQIVLKYTALLDIKYHFKENSGAGASRNFGMQLATGNYFIIFDSDCIIPPNYLSEVDEALSQNYTDAYGGSDAAHDSFTTVQKAINYSMTSFLTTGGIRGSKKAVGKFQPRSFNFGISKKAFEVTQGFSTLKIGEDIDLTFRLWKNNFQTQFIENAFVYHKRRTSLKQFFRQTFLFGNARPFLNYKYPGTAKITYWFPILFVVFFVISLLFLLLGFKLPICLFVIYFVALFIDSFIKNKKISVATLSVVTTLIQFTGYGLGFLKGLFTAD